MDTLLVIWLLGCLAILVFGLLPTFRKRKPVPPPKLYVVPGEISAEEVLARWQAVRSVPPEVMPVSQDESWAEAAPRVAVRRTALSEAASVQPVTAAPPAAPIVPIMVKQVMVPAVVEAPNTVDQETAWLRRMSQAAQQPAREGRIGYKQTFRWADTVRDSGARPTTELARQPRAGQSEQLRATLKQAKQTGEILSVIYHGGSQPGSRRMILPVQITTNKVIAHCYSTGERRTFFIEKLELAAEGEGNEYQPAQARAKTVRASDFRTYAEGFRQSLEGAGWTVQVESQAISLYRHFKNGKLRKTADIGILYQADNQVRRWYVFAPDMDKAKTFRDLEDAFALVLEKAHTHAPSPASTAR